MLAQAGWAFLAFVLTQLGLEAVITGLWWLFAPHKLIDPKRVKLGAEAKEIFAQVSGRVKPRIPAAWIAFGIWLLLVAAWLVWWGVL